MDNYWFEKLKEDSENYKSAHWNDMSEKQRMKTMRNTIGLLREIAAANALNIRFDGELLEFDKIDFRCSRVKIRSSENMRANVGGTFDTNKNTIYINLWVVCSNNGIDVFEHLLHEFAHKLEWELTKQKKNYQNDPKRSKCLSILQNNLKNTRRLFAFGIECGDRLYVTSEAMTNSIVLNDKKAILYALMSTERHAYSMSQSICDKLFYNNCSPQKYLDAIFNFQRMYHCINFSNEQIAMIIDRAQDHIINGTALNNSYEAIVAYDIATTVALHNGAISMEKYVEMQKDDFKEKVLSEMGYQIPWKSENIQSAMIDNEKETLCDLEYLNQLSSEEQLANPELIFQVARNEWEKTLSVVKDIQALKDWYYSESNSIPIGVQEDLGVYLGKDFSPKAREFKMHELGLMIPEDVQENIGIWPYIKTSEPEMDFSDNYNCIEQNLDIER